MISNCTYTGLTNHFSQTEETEPDRTFEPSPITKPSDLSRTVEIDVHSPSEVEPSEAESDAHLTYVTETSVSGDAESEPASSSFDADIDSDYPASSAFSMVCCSVHYLTHLDD